jgi:hypothetical protein
MGIKKLIASHYTIAQVTRILCINYNRMRAVLGRVPGCRQTIYGTPMIAAEYLPALRKAAKDLANGQ